MTKAEQLGKGIRKMVIGCIIAEYGMLEVKDMVQQDLKQRVNNVIKSSKAVQQWFIAHPNANINNRDTFRDEFCKDEIVLLSELVEAVWGMNEQDLEVIIEAIKKNTDAQLTATGPL